MVVQQSRKSPSTVLTANNSTGNRTFMCNIMKESVSQLTFIIYFSEQCLEQYDKIVYFQKYTIYLKDLHILYYKCTESYFYKKK